MIDLITEEFGMYNFEKYESDGGASREANSKLSSEEEN